MYFDFSIGVYLHCIWYTRIDFNGRSFYVGVDHMYANRRYFKVNIFRGQIYFH